MTEQPLMTLGARVAIKPEAQAAVGGDAGGVVGYRDEPPAPGVIIAVDQKPCTNAIVAPEDILDPAE